MFHLLLARRVETGALMRVKVRVRPNDKKGVYEFQVSGDVIVGAEGRWWPSAVKIRYRPEVAVKRILHQFRDGLRRPDEAVPRLPFDDPEPGA